MALPPLPPEGTPFLDAGTGRMNQMWRAFFKAFAPLLEEVAGDIEAIEGDLGELVIKDVWAQTHPEVENGTFFVCRAPTAGTINSTYTDCTSGTCTARWQINGVNVGSAANSVSTTADTETHTTDNTFAAGAIITVVLSSNSSCLGALLNCQVTRDLA
jgi:hypothetical protein